MEMIFNELSCMPLSETNADANEKMVQLIQTYAEGNKKGFKGIRFPLYLHQLNLSETYSMEDWLKQTNQRTLKNLLVGARRYPFIKTEDEWAEKVYIENIYYINNRGTETFCAGLAVAHIYATVSISLASANHWQQNTITINIRTNDNLPNTQVSVPNVFSKACFTQPSIASFIENIGEISLITTQLNPDEKPIHFRDDHGTDVLMAFAKRLVNYAYVDGVINSLEWKPKAINLIHNVFADGKIELVLYWTDKGLGMIIQTTGRSLRETQHIANLIKEKYDH